MQLFCVALWSILCLDHFHAKFLSRPRSNFLFRLLPNEQFGQNDSTLATNWWMFKYKTCSRQPTFYQGPDMSFHPPLVSLQLWKYDIQEEKHVGDEWFIEKYYSTSAPVLTILLISLAEVWSRSRNLNSFWYFGKRQILTYFDIIYHNFELDHLFSKVFLSGIFLPNHMHHMANSEEI